MLPGLVVLLALASVVPAAAQPAGAGQRRGQGHRDDAFRMVDAYIVSNLQESLGLTDEQFVKALPLVKRLLADRRTLVERRRQALRDLRQMFQAGSATEATVAERLREVKALEVEEGQTLRRNLEALDAVLSPVQQAKFRVMEVEIEQRIREIMAQARQRRRGEPPEP
jgi:hypothetical protein